MKIKILIIEAEVEIEGVKAFYEKIFKNLNYECDFVAHTPDINVKDYNEFDILITDISYGMAMSDSTGLVIASKAKQDYPNLFVITNTKEYDELTLHQITQNLPEPDLLLNKSMFIEPIYKDYVTKQISNNFKSNVLLKIDREKSILSDFLRDNITDLETIIKKITFRTHNMESNILIDKAILKPLISGFSGSEVYKMNLYTNKGLSCINTVLKTTNKLKDAEEEIKNYLEYVKWYLPYSWRPELIGYSFSKTLGVICYSFAYDNEKDFLSLTDYLLQKDFDKLSLTIEKIFKPNFQRWYHKSNIVVEKDSSLTDYYFNKWFSNRKHGDNLLQNIINEYFAKDDKNLIKDYSQNIGKYLFGNLSYVKYQTCICHGDLNSNNILISDDEQLTFIDFKDTKRGHVFEDFIVFEGAIRMNLKLDLIFSESLQLEEMLCNNIAVNSNKINTNGFSSNINNIREYAFETFKDEEKRYYFYGLALYCFRLLRIRNMKEWQYKQIIACLISAMKKIKID